MNPSPPFVISIKIVGAAVVENGHAVNGERERGLFFASGGGINGRESVVRKGVKSRGEQDGPSPGSLKERRCSSEQAVKRRRRG